MKMTLKDLESQVGSLGCPSKMPGYSWSIPAKHCKIGSKLRKQPGTVCFKCYALKGRYSFPNVQDALQARLDAFNAMDRDEWCEAMAALIARKVRPEVPYFRVFDSGDLQSEEMMIRWALVARMLPDVKFWVSTRERAIVNRAMKRMGLHKLKNLVVRVSSHKIGLTDSAPLSSHNSQVHPKVQLMEWEALVRKSTRKQFYCPSSLQDGKCGECRACWDSKVTTVIYREH